MLIQAVILSSAFSDSVVMRISRLLRSMVVGFLFPRYFVLEPFFVSGLQNDFGVKNMYNDYKTVQVYIVMKLECRCE